MFDFTIPFDTFFEDKKHSGRTENEHTSYIERT